MPLFTCAIFQESYNRESSLGDVWFLQGMAWSILIKWKGITTDLFSNSHFDCSKLILWVKSTQMKYYSKLSCRHNRGLIKYASPTSFYMIADLPFHPRPISTLSAWLTIGLILPGVSYIGVYSLQCVCSITVGHPTAIIMKSVLNKKLLTIYSFFKIRSYLWTS